MPIFGILGATNTLIPCGSPAGDLTLQSTCFLHIFIRGSPDDKCTSTKCYKKST